MSAAPRPSATGLRTGALRLVMLFPITLALGLAFRLDPPASSSDARSSGPPTATPTPEPDPLAIPILPENPGPFDVGRVTYYYNCMPCHGDKGQGLTDEWRLVWEEDHQDCWSRGCHGEKAGDQAFPIPRYVPPVMGPSSGLTRFTSEEDLSDFLWTSHPPQRPGDLDETECQALAAYLSQNAPSSMVLLERAPAEEGNLGPPSEVLALRIGAILAFTLGAAWLIGRQDHPQS